MTQKPSPQSILSSHSLSDLLDLIKAKSKMDFQESITTLQSQIQDIASNFGASTSKQLKPSSPKPKTKSSPKAKSNKRAKNKQPVSDMILSVLSSTPMNISSILEGIQAKGFKTTSKNPKQIIALQLIKLSKEKKIKKAGFGLYVLAGNDSVGKKVSSSKGTVKKSTKKKSSKAKSKSVTVS